MAIGNYARREMLTLRHLPVWLLYGIGQILRVAYVLYVKHLFQEATLIRGTNLLDGYRVGISFPGFECGDT